MHREAGCWMSGQWMGWFAEWVGSLDGCGLWTRESAQWNRQLRQRYVEQYDEQYNEPAPSLRLGQNLEHLEGLCM